MDDLGQAVHVTSHASGYLPLGGRLMDFPLFEGNDQQQALGQQERQR